MISLETERDSLRFTPLVLDLRGVGDGIVGADVWGGHAVTIDYSAGLLTFQRDRPRKSKLESPRSIRVV